MFPERRPRHDQQQETSFDEINNQQEPAEQRRSSLSSNDGFARALALCTHEPIDAGAHVAVIILFGQ